MVLQASFVLDSVRDVLQHFETSPGVSLLHVDVAQVLLALAESYSLPLPQNLAVLAIVLQAAPLLEDGLQVFVELVQNGFGKLTICTTGRRSTIRCYNCKLR